MNPLRELRFALRRLTRTPGPSLTATIVLGAGLGACLVVWLWIDHLVLRPIPGIPEPDRIRAVWSTSRDGSTLSLSTPVVRDLAEAAPRAE